MGYEALNTTQRLGKREVLEPGNKSLHARNAARQLECHDGPESGLLAQRQLMSRMCRQSRVVHLRHTLLFRQPRRERKRVAAVDRQARMKGTQAAQRQVAIEGGTGQPQAVRPPRQLLAELRF